jgi:hypothetical protein
MDGSLTTEREAKGIRRKPHREAQQGSDGRKAGMSKTLTR